MHIEKLVILGVAAVLTGCGSSEVVARRQHGIIVGTQGAGSEVVFHGVQLAEGVPLAGEEHARRDGSLNVRGAMTAFEADAWPAAPGPALDEARYLHLPRNANTHIYFNTAYPRGRGHGPHGPADWVWMRSWY